MNTKQFEVKSRSYDIVGGPNRDLLFDACKYAHSRGVDIPVVFSIINSSVLTSIMNIRINGIEHEDGSGESFNLHGYCESDVNHRGGIPVFKSYGFKAWYNSKSRKGYITLTER